MAQGKRGGGPSSKNSPKSTAVSNTDDSYIVFSNGKDDPNVKSRSTDHKPPVDKGTVGAKPSGEDAPKKPDTRTLIGGASWTGKLPVNLLSEHCQKHRWEKPEYSMVSSCYNIFLTATDYWLKSIDENARRLYFWSHTERSSFKDQGNYCTTSICLTSFT